MNERANARMTDLSDEQIDAISGGLIIDRGEDCGDEDRFVLVNDQDGRPILFSDSMESCIVRANGGHKGTGPTYSTAVITPAEYAAKFGRQL